jgi:hypothetical protein
MIRLQLKCVHGDYFDAWFPDRECFDAQSAKAQIVCPECGETQLAEAPPLKPGFYPELTEDQARQMSCDTRRMLADWLARGGMQAVSGTLAEQAVHMIPPAPEPAPPLLDDQADERPDCRPAPDKPTQRPIAYDC